MCPLQRQAKNSFANCAYRCDHAGRGNVLTQIILEKAIQDYRQILQTTSIKDPVSRKETSSPPSSTTIVNLDSRADSVDTPSMKPSDDHTPSFKFVFADRPSMPENPGFGDKLSMDYNFTSANSRFTKSQFGSFPNNRTNLQTQNSKASVPISRTSQAPSSSPVSRTNPPEQTQEAPASSISTAQSPSSDALNTHNDTVPEVKLGASNSAAPHSYFKFDTPPPTTPPKATPIPQDVEALLKDFLREVKEKKPNGITVAPDLNIKPLVGIMKSLNKDQVKMVVDEA